MTDQYGVSVFAGNASEHRRKWFGRSTYHADRLASLAGY
jgi:hypothetical protein